MYKECINANLQASLANAFHDEREVVYDETVAGDAPGRVTVVTVTRLVKQAVLIHVVLDMEPREGVLNPLVRQERGETRGLDQQVDDTLWDWEVRVG